MIGPEAGQHCSAGGLVRQVLQQAQFIQNDGALFFDFVRIHGWLEHHARHDLEHLRPGFGGHLCAHNRQFRFGGRVDLAAETLDGTGKCARIVGTLSEQHVLNKVRDAAGFGCFAARANPGRDMQAYGCGVGHGGRD